jgi:hypothetical protein
MTKDDPADKKHQCPCGSTGFRVYITPMGRVYLECSECDRHFHGEETAE